MKPVMQTKFGKPEGNCWAACIASMLEVGIDAVPAFPVEDGKPHWYDATKEWLHSEHGLDLLSLHVDLTKADQRRYWRDSKCYWIAGGKSPRGDFQHATIFKGIELAHDPHPSGEGFLGDPTDATVFVPIDLGQWWCMEEENP